MTLQICYHAKFAFMLVKLYQTVNNIKDAKVFQSDINVVYELFMKCQAINLGRQTLTSHRHKLGTSCHTTYVVVIIQSELNFDQHINGKCLKSRKLLRGDKHLMSDASKEAKLLA